MGREDTGKFLRLSVPCHKHDEGATYMFIHVLGDVGHVEVGVGLVGELLELGIE